MIPFSSLSFILPSLSLFQSKSTPIESMDWFKCLLSYAYQEGEDPDPLDSDTHLIPEVIDRVVLSKLTSES